jgi:hypothetical protein
MGLNGKIERGRRKRQLGMGDQSLTGLIFLRKLIF